MTFQSETWIKKTRKAHRCAFCGMTIAKGSHAVRRTGVWDGDFFSETGHQDCAAMWNAAYPDFADTWEGMPYDLVEAMLEGASEAETADVLNHFRGSFPHPVCRIELRLLQSDLRWIERQRNDGIEPDAQDIPEIYG